MSLISLIAALLLEQWRPLSDRRNLLTPLSRYVMYLERQFNAGESHHGVIAWSLVIIPAVMCIWLVYWLANHVSPLAALVLNVLTLYVTMGFRQFSHYFTAIQLALKEDDLPRARQLLAEWRGHNCGNLGREEIVRLSIEGALTASHRHVFAVIFWFVLLPGPSGAVLYRLASFLDKAWGGGALGDAELGCFGKFAHNAFEFLDWLPVRVTAAAFAVVGDFEDAVYCWRTQAAKWNDRALGIVLATGAGALGVRLGMPLEMNGEVEDRPELGVGEYAESGFLDSTVGLVWRALVLYLLMLLIIGVAKVVS